MAVLIPNTEIKAHVDDNPEWAIGETKHFFHCKEGHNNNRFYVTHVENGVYVGYCHHCGGKGVYREKFARVKSKLAGSSPKKIHRDYKLPRTITTNMSEWSSKAKVWLWKAMLTDDEIKDRGFCYDTESGRVLLPIYFDGEYQGYLSRRVEDNDEAKYLAMSKDREKFVLYSNQGTSDCTVVEDALSFIRISRHTSCVCLFGTSISDNVLNLIRGNHSKYNIWLDNDNRQVKIKQLQLKAKLELFGSVRMIKTDKDPKEHSDPELKEVLCL
ncbi:DNA primase [Vibrio phage MJW]